MSLFHLILISTAKKSILNIILARLFQLVVRGERDFGAAWLHYTTMQWRASSNNCWIQQRQSTWFGIQTILKSLAHYFTLDKSISFPILPFNPFRLAFCFFIIYLFYFMFLLRFGSHTTSQTLCCWFHDNLLHLPI